MTLVVDASVILKWLFADPAREDLTEQATTLMADVVTGTYAIRQPVHWLLEVAAVLARLTPAGAQRDIVLLDELQLPVCDASLILERACDLSIRLDHHLFDTLYHAVAVECDGVLVTADDRYYRKASAEPSIVHLRDWVITD